MKFGFCLPNFDGTVSPAAMLESGTLAEELGFDSVWATDHIIVPRQHLHPYGDLVEPFVCLSYLAARTSRVQLGTSVIVLPQRNPLLVAKQAAALDVISRGRLRLGVGAGWLREEFRFLGEEFTDRGKRFDEEIRLMRSVWKDDVVGFPGKYYRVRGAVSLPHPSKPIPVLIGGSSPAAVDRAARLGDGWHPVGVTPAQLEQGRRTILRKNAKAEISARLRIVIGSRQSKYVSASGQTQTGLAGSVAEVSSQLEKYSAVGLGHVALGVAAKDAKSLTASLRSIARELVPSFR